MIQYFYLLLKIFLSNSKRVLGFIYQKNNYFHNINSRILQIRREIPENKASCNIWFWQLIISPHMADLAVALARQGCKVTYIAQQVMSADRACQGWSAPALPGVELQLADSDKYVRSLVRTAPEDVIHFCQGLRANGRVSLAQRELAILGRQQWVVMETVDDTGWKGVLKRGAYSLLFMMKRKSLQGVLTTGHRTAAWVAARGMPSSQIFSFAYFLPNPFFQLSIDRAAGQFRFVFAGRLVSLKRVDWLVKALASLTNNAFELWIVGTGPEENNLRAFAAVELGDRVRWFGQLPIAEVPLVLAQADCLVLPSVHDGWGAVASEALMNGTPVICSDACGVAEVVKASGTGGVFDVNDFISLSCLLDVQLRRGLVEKDMRENLAHWAACLSADAGAAYLKKILDFRARDVSTVPSTPWSKKRELTT